MRRGKTERLTVLPSSARDRKHDDYDHGHASGARQFLSRLGQFIPQRLRHAFGRPSSIARTLAVTLLLLGAVAWLVYVFTNPSTLVFAPLDLQRIWQWEIASGHHPGSKPSECK